MFRRLRSRIKNLKLRQRMILVYAIGCFLPLIFVLIFMFYSSRNSLIDMELSEEQALLDAGKEQIESTMDFAVEMSDRMFFDSMLQMIGMPSLSGGEELLFSYRDFNELKEYVREYYGQIATISVYVEPGTVDRVDNKSYKLITDTIREKDWYISTINADGRPCWSYLTDFATGRRSIRLTRILYTRVNRKMAGIISISLDPELTEGFISGLNGYSMMTLNGKSIVHSNFDITDEETDELLSKNSTNDPRERISFRDASYFLTGVKISPRFSEDYYEILSLRSVKEVDDAVIGAAGRTVLPLIAAVAIMLIAIISFNSWFTKRISALGTAMHKVTEKNYDTDDTGIGDAKDEIWDLYNDMNRMVRNMQELSDAAANERIQKEQLYSRQRDVEFKMLTTQINPHFLYNTLENIRMLAVINKESEIEDISVRLTRLLRSSLEAGGELKTLAWEMDKVDCYIKIQDYRFGDRITAVLEYDTDIAEKVMIMPFIVQPFVENAYVHAMEEMEEGGRIEIRATVTDTLDLIIEDNGRGMTEQELNEILQSMDNVEDLDRTHIGIANVNQRIRLRFGDEYGVKFTSEEGKGTRVEIHMPLLDASSLS